MSKLTKICFLLSLFLSTAVTGQNKKTQALYKDAKRTVEDRVSNLLSQMTLEEKVMQLNQYTLGRNNNENNIADPVKDIPAQIGSLIYFNSDPELRNKMQKKAMEQTRLGIPIIFGYDVIHGFRTVYPISLGQACSWNPALVEQACAVAAQEARMSGVDWTFSPMIDVARDGRWGRVSEGYGEDPYTNAVFGVASVKGYQGTDLSSPVRVAACLKHYIGYGASEAGRDYVYTEVSDQTLWDTYMLPYEAGVKAGAATLMSSFNDLNGTPGTANQYTLRQVLKERWKHDGFVVSDWGAIEQLRPQGVAKDKKEAAFKAFTAGVEMDMMNKCYDTHLGDLVKEGKVSQEMLNDAVRRVLRLKFRLGLFEHPYTTVKAEKQRLLLSENLKIAERLAEESIVLLKNTNNTLPLVNASKIAIIGPMATNKADLLGSWKAHGEAGDVTSIYEAFQKEFTGKSQIVQAKGCDFNGDDKSLFEEARSIARLSDVVIVCLGERGQWSGENASRSSIRLPLIQEELLMELKRTGKPIILVLSSGRPIDLSRLEPACDAILTIWQPGLPGGKPVAGVVRGRVNPSGKLAMTFPYSTGQIPIYYNHRQSARPHQGKYQDIPSTPLFEFGHGLSYTTFHYGDLKASSQKVNSDGKITVEVTVKNIGQADGMETVHWYIADPVSTISRPVKELKYFEKQLIRKGDTYVFRFQVDVKRDLGFVNGKGEKFVEEGEYFVMVKDKKIKIEVDNTKVGVVGGTLVKPTYDSSSVIRNPLSGWVMYAARDADASCWDKEIYVKDLGKRVKVIDYASACYLRTSWASLNPRSGVYAWRDPDTQIGKLIRGALERGLPVGLRIVVDGRDQGRNIPQFVLDAGVRTYLENANYPARVTPIPQDPIFKQYYGKFIEELAKDFNDPEKTAFIDAYGLGKWGEAHNVVYAAPGKSNDHEKEVVKEQVFDWITDLYTRTFTNVPLVINYHRVIGDPISWGVANPNSYRLLVKAINKGYSLRQDAFGMTDYYGSWEKQFVNNWIFKRPVIMEGGWIVSSHSYWNDSSKKYRQGHPEDVRLGEFEASAEAHVNMMDFRAGAETDSWFQNNFSLVQRFISEGGYRLYPDEVYLPEKIIKGAKATITHRWRNTGWGYCPNNIPQWHNKFKVAFALLDADGNVKKVFVDKDSEPSNWLKDKPVTYEFKSAVDVPAGTYSWAVAIVDTSQGNKPGINLAIDGNITKSGWAKLLAIQVQ